MEQATAKNPSGTFPIERVREQFPLLEREGYAQIREEAGLAA